MPGGPARSHMPGWPHQRPNTSAAVVMVVIPHRARNARPDSSRRNTTMHAPSAEPKPKPSSASPGMPTARIPKRRQAGQRGAVCQISVGVPPSLGARQLRVAIADAGVGLVLWRIKRFEAPRRDHDTPKPQDIGICTIFQILRNMLGSEGALDIGVAGDGRDLVAIARATATRTATRIAIQRLQAATRPATSRQKGFGGRTQPLAGWGQPSSPPTSSPTTCMNLHDEVFRLPKPATGWGRLATWPMHVWSPMASPTSGASCKSGRNWARVWTIIRCSGARHTIWSVSGRSVGSARWIGSGPPKPAPHQSRSQKQRNATSQVPNAHVKANLRWAASPPRTTQTPKSSELKANQNQVMSTSISEGTQEA